MRGRLKILGFLLCSFLVVKAQFSAIGNGGFSGTQYGPVNVDTTADSYSRYAYIYPSGSLGDLKHGDNIRALSFLNKGVDSIKGDAEIKVYLKSTNQADFGGGSINWNTEMANGMTLVHQGSLQSSLVSDMDKLTIVFNQTNIFQFDTIGNAVNLQIFIEYTQDSAQDKLVTWYFETSFYVNEFVSNNEAKSIRGTGALDSICNASTIIKPTLEIYYPRYNKDIAIRKISALGSVPVVLAIKDSIRVLVSNDGRNTISSQSIGLTISGSNTFSSSLGVSDLAPFEQRWIIFSDYEPTYLGEETLSINTSDDFSGNNSSLVSRDVTYNQISHKEINIGNTGDYQFTSSSADFASRYHCNSFKQISGVSLDFNSTGVSYKVAVWNGDGPQGSPGTLVYLSDTYTTAIGTQYKPISQVFMGTDFYIGIRKLTSTHTLIGYQGNNPVPSGIHYIAQPAGDTIWRNRKVNDGFIFDISAQLITPNDVSVHSIITPGNLDTFFYSTTDSMAIRAKIVNRGYTSKNSITAKLELLNRFDQVILSSTMNLSLQSGEESTIIFDKISREYFGLHKLRVSVNTVNDEVGYNDELTREIILVVSDDVAITNVFTPSYLDTFDVNLTGFYPVARVINLGQKDQEDIPILFQMVQSGEVFYEETRYVSLKAQFSKIQGFDFISPSVPGDITARFITLLGNDIFLGNDTLNVPIFGRVIHDVLVDSVLVPTLEQKFEINSSFQPKARILNRGLNDESSIHVYYEIVDLNSNQIYIDSTISSLATGLSSTHTFKTFMCDSFGDYIACVYVKSPEDQYSRNDTLCHLFYVTENYNLKINGLDFPDNQEVIRRNTPATYPVVELNNIGKDSVKNALISIKILDGVNEVYSDSITITLGVDSVELFSFTESLDFSINGDFSVEVINRWSSESTPSSNDTFYSTYSVRPYLDISVTQFVTPEDGDTFELYSEINLKVTLANEGIILANNSRIALQVENVNKDTLFRDTLSYGRLITNSVINLQSALFWYADKVGDYRLEAKIISDDDEESNNIISEWIKVVKTADVLVDSILFPEKDLVLNSGQPYVPKANFINDGTTDLDFIVVKYEMWDDSLIHQESKIIEILSYDSLEVEFAAVTFSLARDTVKMIVTCESLKDGYTFNDTLRSQFSVKKINGIQELEDPNLLVYPNPFTRKLKIRAHSPIQRLTLYSQDGQAVYTSVDQSSMLSISPDIQSGVYLLEVQTANRTIRKRVVHISR
ncbi:MAG: hypothetical protein COA58_00675 [Bacteroidetes bacterium]|nr:MAG: hypothetical protein COA58_00675 [Bacteroidota bacterium]